MTRLRHNNILLFILMLLLVGIACVWPPPTPTPTRPEESDGGVGTIRREESNVRYGPSMAALEELTGIEDLWPNSALQVTDGGEARLNFGNNLELRAYNNSQMDVRMDLADSPLIYNMYLYRGVTTGRLTTTGHRAIWETPNGVEITISGTDFFVAYDPVSDTTWVGNFNGSVEIAHPSLPGGSRAVPPNNGYVIPGAQFSLGGETLDRFQALVDNLTEPLDGVREYGDGTETAPPDNGGDVDIIEPEPIPIPPDEETVNMLFSYSGELDQWEVPYAMLHAFPYREMGAEVFGVEVNLFLAPVGDFGSLREANEFGYDEDEAWRIFSEIFYMATPPELRLIVVDIPEFTAIMEAAGGFYEEMGFPVGVQFVPSSDYFEVVSSAAQAGENVWALGPGP